MTVNTALSDDIKSPLRHVMIPQVKLLIFIKHFFL